MELQRRTSVRSPSRPRLNVLEGLWHMSAQPAAPRTLSTRRAATALAKNTSRAKVDVGTGASRLHVNLCGPLDECRGSRNHFLDQRRFRTDACTVGEDRDPTQPWCTCSPARLRRLLALEGVFFGQPDSLNRVRSRSRRCAHMPTILLDVDRGREGQRTERSPLRSPSAVLDCSPIAGDHAVHVCQSMVPV